MRRTTDRAHGGRGAARCHRTDGFIGANNSAGPETRKASAAAMTACEVRATSGGALRKTTTCSWRGTLGS